MPAPWEKYQQPAQQGGPIYGPAASPPPPPPPPSGYQPAGAGLAPIPGGPADPNAPQNLPQPEPAKAPAGYRFKADGSLEPIPGGPKDRGGDTQGIARENLLSVLTKIDEIDRDARDNNGWFETGGTGSLMRRVGPSGTPAYDLAQNIQTIDANSAFASLQAMRDASPTGGALGQITERELDLLKAKVANLDPNQSQEQFLANLGDARQFYVKMLERVDPGAANSYQGGGNDDEPAPRVLSPGGPNYAPSTESRTVSDPKLDAISSEYRQRLAAGQGASEIIPWLKEQGATTQTQMQVIEQLRYRDENPEVPVEKYSITSDKEVPLSTYEKTVTELGGGGVGAFMVGAGQFLSGNTLDNLAPDPKRARLANSVVQARNPGSYMAGEVAGGVLAGLTGEAALARLGMGSTIGRSALADAGMGGANGAGMADDGGRVQNALLGATLGGATSAGGAIATRGAANALAPTGGSARGLYEQGIRPTIGQRVANAGGGRGVKGTVGGLINAAEEQLQSVPLVGAAIRGARQDARDEFQVGAFNLALGEVGEQLPKNMKPGTAPHRHARKVFDRVYDEAREGMRLVGDEELQNSMQGIAESAQLLSEDSPRRFERIMTNIVMRRVPDDGGAMSGAAYKKVQSDLGKQIRSIRNNQSGDAELAGVLEELQFALDGAARRHSDPAAVELLDAADAGYAKLVRIEEAARRAGGGQGEFTPTQFDRAVQKTSGGLRSKAYLRGEALMQDYAQQGSTLIDRVPNSGTPERQMAGMAAAGGLGYIDPTFLTGLGAIGAMYTPGVRKVTRGAFAPAGPKRGAIARRLRNRARLVGRTSAATSAAALPETAPGQ